MIRGRKPKPTKLKRLAGNPGKRPLNQHEARIPPEIPTCPSHLLGEARKEWNRMSAELYKAGLLTLVDRAALAGYCQGWARWVKAEKQLTKRGEVVLGVNGTLKVNPWHTVAKNAKEEMRKFLIEFGMSPASRSRVQAAEMEQGTLADWLFAKAKAEAKAKTEETE
jgi:P27 family predicted phage terminase small subunit